ncbi:MAG: sugar ABC transporter ATP-binding protein [Aggregatilineales bacterium]
MTQPTVELKGITKRFPGVLALDNVSLSIYSGQVHAVLGENGAGKSTLMNILAGEIHPDAGEIIIAGKSEQISSPMVAQRLGISVVFQELALCPNLSIMENISLNALASMPPLAFIHKGKLRQRAKEVLDSLGINQLDPFRQVGKLSVAQQQLVEIAKAISTDVKVLILDEPNSALTSEETEHLFKVILDLRDSGVAVIYISHRLEEVVQIADTITVLRDGRHIDTFENNGEVTIDGIIRKMVGREVDHFFKREREYATTTDLILQVDGVSSHDLLRDITFSVSRGEIVGLAGLPDAGKDELVECLFGLRPYEGKLVINGKRIVVHSPADAINNGMVLIPADRRGAGALLVMDVEDNTIASSLKHVNRGGFIDRRASRSVTENYVQKLDVRIASLKQKMMTLSGGNQQKVIIGRGLATNPSVLVLHEPTRGIDVGAKVEIYTILQRLAQSGAGILIVSSELPELLGQCDRIFVLHQGRIRGEFTRETASEEAILAAAMGQSVDIQESQHSEQ